MFLIRPHLDGSVPANTEQHPRIKRFRLYLMSTNKRACVHTPVTSRCAADLKHDMQMDHALFFPLLCFTCANLSS